jgi:hypothetical protein
VALTIPESVQLHRPRKARTVIGVNAKPNPKPCNASVQDTSMLAFCGGSVAERGRTSGSAGAARFPAGFRGGAGGHARPRSLPPERPKYASGLFNMMRNLGGAVGIAVCGAILNAQTNFHFNMIASHLTPANGPMDRLIAGVAQRYGAIPGSPEAGHLAALKALWQLAYREASTLAYADAFRTIMVAFIAATLLVPLLRRATPTIKASAGDAH